MCGDEIGTSQQYTTARAYFQESLRLYTEIEQQGVVPPGLTGAGNEKNLLADTYRELGELEVAEKHYLQAIAYFQQRSPQHGWYLKTIMQRLSSLYTQLGRDAEASEWWASSSQLDNRVQLPKLDDRNN